MSTLLKDISVTLDASEMAIAASFPPGHPSRESCRTLARWHCAWLLLKDDPSAARAIEAALQVWCASNGWDQGVVQRVLDNSTID